MSTVLLTARSADYEEKTIVEFQLGWRKWGFIAQQKPHALGSYTPVSTAQVIHALRTIADEIERAAESDSPR